MATGETSPLQDKTVRGWDCCSSGPLTQLRHPFSGLAGKVSILQHRILAEVL